MRERQVKSKKRVADYGEVFTAKREVDSMLGLLGDVPYSLESTFLEPACGDGNFLDEILRRKLSTAFADADSETRVLERNSLIALSSIYGIEIQPDNAKDCRQRLLNTWREALKERLGAEPTENTEKLAEDIVGRNIICGDFLTFQQLDESGNVVGPIKTTEWIWEGRETPASKQEILEIPAETLMAKKQSSKAKKKTEPTEGEGNLLFTNETDQETDETTQTETSPVAHNSPEPSWEEEQAKPDASSNEETITEPAAMPEPKQAPEQETKTEEKPTPESQPIPEQEQTPEPSQKPAAKSRRSSRKEAKAEEVSVQPQEEPANKKEEESSDSTPERSVAEQVKSSDSEKLPVAYVDGKFDLSVYPQEEIARPFHPIVDKALAWGSNIAENRRGTLHSSSKADEIFDENLPVFLETVQRAFNCLDDGDADAFRKLTGKARKLITRCQSAIALFPFNAQTRNLLKVEGKSVDNLLSIELKRLSTYDHEEE